MKRVILAAIFYGCFIPFVFSQNADHVNGGSFRKTVEYNYDDILLLNEKLIPIGYKCNLDGKEGVEKLFFGDFNTPVEFFYDPSFEASTKGATGFRMIRDSTKSSCILEIKHIPNFEEVFTRNYDDDGKLKLYKIETLSFSVSKQFAEELYKRNVMLIEHFKAKGVAAMGVDGYSVTFRTVVDDEAWSLWIHEPTGNALKMTDLCNRIIKDAVEGKLHEAEYLSVLNAM